MKISNKIPSPMQSPQNPEAAKATKAGGAEAILDAKKGNNAAKAGEIGGSSRIDLSSRAQEMAKAKELATPSNDIDEAKVARLQKLIDEGKYKVNAEAVAERLLAEHTKMPT